jgi:hypothetical protein
MRLLHLRLLAAALLGAPLSAQNFVTNGDFSAGITGWTEAGFSFNPMVESYDTTGLGASQCYACSPGGQVTPPPYLPNSIEQTVLIAPGIPYEFTAEIAVDAVATSSNADAGTFWVEVGGVEVTRTALGGYTQGLPQRARLGARFTLTTGGPQTLRINFHRRFLCNQTTPRTRIDDITLRIAQGPLFCLRGNRRLGGVNTVDVLGAPNEAIIFFLSPARLGTGIQVPGIGGLWFLNPARMSLFFSGVTGAGGLYSFPLTLPNDPALLTGVAYVQGLQVSAAAQINLGSDQFLTFVK